MHLSATLFSFLCNALLAMALSNALDTTHNAPTLQAREPKNYSPPGSPDRSARLPSSPSTSTGGRGDSGDSITDHEDHDILLSCPQHGNIDIEQCYLNCLCTQDGSGLRVTCLRRGPSRMACERHCRCLYTRGDTSQWYDTPLLRMMPSGTPGARPVRAPTGRRNRSRSRS